MCERYSLHQEPFKGTFGAEINEREFSGSNIILNPSSRPPPPLGGGGPDLARDKIYDSEGVMKGKS